LIDKFVQLKEAIFNRQNQYVMSTSTRPKLEKKIVFKREQLTYEEEHLKEQLKKELATLDAEIEELLLEKQKHEQQLQMLIEDLHRYNDLKDAAQNIFGRLAELEGTTTKEMYRRYDLELED
jgi:chromosome segregation ATPase